MSINDQSDRRRDGHFETTHWSLVLSAGRQSSAAASAALSTLCERYWQPLYVYARRRVAQTAEAQDLTQEFFARLLERNLFGQARQERGRFRAFLLTSFKHFLVNEWEKAKSQKRGGTTPVLSLDFAASDSKCAWEPAHDLTPERLFDRQWAMTLLDHVLALLRTEYAAAEKERHFEVLKVFLTGRPEATSYAEIGQTLGLTEGAAKVSAHRLRKRYRQLLRSEIAQTVADPGDVDDEISQLFEVLG